jgi:hypothetical protein
VGCGHELALLLLLLWLESCKIKARGTCEFLGTNKAAAVTGAVWGVTAFGAKAGGTV